MAFTTVLDPRAIDDIQKAIDYYDNKHPGLGEQFESVLNQHIIQLEQHPYFQARYDNVHCLPLKKYPYMIHFTIDENKKELTILAVFNTYRNPKIWKTRK
jgi:hypothetical protein